MKLIGILLAATFLAGCSNPNDQFSHTVKLYSGGQLVRQYESKGAVNRGLNGPWVTFHDAEANKDTAIVGGTVVITRK